MIFLESYVQLHSVPDMEMESEFISSQVSPTKVGHFVAIWTIQDVFVHDLTFFLFGDLFKLFES